MAASLYLQRFRATRDMGAAATDRGVARVFSTVPNWKKLLQYHIRDMLQHRDTLVASRRTIHPTVESCCCCCCLFVALVRVKSLTATINTWYVAGFNTRHRLKSFVPREGHGLGVSEGCFLGRVSPAPISSHFDAARTRTLPCHPHLVTRSVARG